MTRGRGFLFDLAIAVGLPLVPFALFALDAARVNGFAADQAISYAQAARHLEQLSYPMRGLMNSHAFWNPNGLVLLTSALLVLARGPLAFAILLSVAQAAAVLACYRWLTREPAGRRSWVLSLTGIPLLLWTPVLSHTSVDLWAQYIARTLLCLLFVLALSTRTVRSTWRDAAFGFLLAFAPAVHLGLLAAVPVTLLPLLLPRRRAQVRLAALAAGAVVALTMSWIPWIASGAASSILDGRRPTLDSSRYWSAVLGPVFELPGLLTSPYEGWFSPARDRILSAHTEGILQAFADVRCIAGLAVLMTAALLMLARRQTGRAAIEILVYVLLLVYLWEANGASLEQRPDFGTMVLQPLYLGVAASAYRMLKACEDWTRESGSRVCRGLLHGCALVAVAWMATSWGRGTLAISRDVRECETFATTDIPLEEKLAALDALDQAATGRATASVTYKNDNFYATFPFVAAYGGREGASPQDYRSGSFFELTLNSRSGTRYTFVDTSESFEFAVTFPSSSQWAQDLGCRCLWRGRRLAVWECADGTRQEHPTDAPRGAEAPRP